MQSDSELFDEAVNSVGLGSRLPDGARLRLIPTFSEYKAFAEQRIEGFRSGGKTLKPFPRVLVDYMDSLEVGAWAFPYKSIYVIALNYGTVLILHSLSNRLLCSREVLPEIGNVASETDNLPVFPLTSDFKEFSACMLSLGLSPEDIIPKDPDRKTIADFIAFISIYFLLGHEFRHIQAGHVDYGKNRFNLNYISETPLPSPNLDVNMKRQAMEWDADKFSAQAIVAGIWINRSIVLRYPESLNPVFANHKLTFLLCLIAFTLLFRLFDDDKPQPPEWKSCTHPPSRNRRIMLITDASILMGVMGQHILNESEVNYVVAQSATIIDLLLPVVGFSAFDRDYSMLVTKEGLRHWQEIVTTWGAIYSDLQKHSYTQLFPL